MSGDIHLKNMGNELKTICKYHYVITCGKDPDAVERQQYMNNIFNLMDIKFTFFEICSEEDVQPFVSKMIGYYDRKINRVMREIMFVKSKYKRTMTMISYYILWCQCQVMHPNDNVMIWEDSVILNTSLTTNTCLDIIKDCILNLPSYDMFLLGHFPKQFKTDYIDDGKYRLKCQTPVNGYKEISRHLLKLNYGFPCGIIIYSPSGINKLVENFENNFKTTTIHPFESFIANMMDKSSVYCVNPSVFGQILDNDPAIW